MVCSLHSVTTGSRDRANVSLIIIIIIIITLISVQGHQNHNLFNLRVLDYSVVIWSYMVLEKLK